MSILTESTYPGDVLKFELGGSIHFSRDNITQISGAGSLAVGTVLGQITMGALVSAAKGGGNTGNGTCVVDATTPVLPFAVTGAYTATCTVAGTNSATFRVVDPRGVVLGDMSFSGSGASATFADRIKFAITDGSTDFVVGDAFVLTLAAGSGKYTQMNLTAADGSQNAAGVLLAATDSTSADKVTIAATRSGILASNKLIWPGSISGAQQAAATAQLAALGLTIRTGV